MAYQYAIANHQGRYADPTIRAIGTPDVFDILAKGVADFNEKPSHLFFLTLIYPLVILFLARLALGDDLLPLLFPLAAGFVLLGPLAVIGLYELSPRRESGQEITWRHAFGALKSPSLGVVGNAVGFLFALAVRTISVVSFPRLLDRDVDAGRAMSTSIRARARPCDVAFVSQGRVVVKQGSDPFAASVAADSYAGQRGNPSPMDLIRDKRTPSDSPRQAARARK